jgi:cardiolipin synthase
MHQETAPTYNLLKAGKEIFPALLAAINSAKKSICLEIYTFTSGDLGKSFLDALIHAAKRGVQVRLLVDAVGSITLSNNFWTPLHEAGGKVRVFNPLTLKRFWIRNHRKLLVCDDEVAFVGGFNIAPEYEGDGVKSGWCDVGLKIQGPLVKGLAQSFEEMFARAHFRHKRFSRFHKSGAKKSVSVPQEELLFSGPGRGRSPIKRALHRDLSRAKNVRIMVAYFLPTWQIRRDLVGVIRRGGKVQLILPGKSDVPLSQLAAQSFYRRFLKSNIEIHEYQPQILHAKMFIMDDVVYIGSCNLDARSLNINYELLVRIQSETVWQDANKIFDGNLKHCRQITLHDWKKKRTFWRRLKRRWAYFLLNRLDPYFARKQWRALPD